MTDPAAFGWNELGASIHDRFARVVRATPSAAAVVGTLTTYSYDELDTLSFRIAAGILAQRGPAPEAIGILMDHDAPAIAVLLGIIASGKHYLALDGRQPQSLLRTLLTEAEVGLVISDAANGAQASAVAPDGCTVVNWEDLTSRIPRNQSAVLPPVTSETAAGLSFTSGSTGRPKGLLRSHARTLATGWLHANTYGVGSGDRVALVFHLAGGGSSADIFGSVLNGATLCLFDVHHEGVDAMVNWLEKEGITFLHPPVPLYRELVGSGRDLRSRTVLRLVVLAGQTVTFRDYDQFCACFPRDCKLVVRLAMTETGVVSQITLEHDAHFTTRSLPVGYAVPGFEINVRDEDGLLSPSGEGEIVIGSSLVCDGYWKRPEETRERFLPDPADPGRRFFLTGDLGRLHTDGLLEHLGRKDQMVKVRGYRVELPAVELALRSAHDVQEAACVARVDPLGETQLIAFVAPQPNAVLTASSLRRSLADRLAQHEIPGAFVISARLPLTSSGKIDRRALQDEVQGLGLQRPRPALDTPYTAATTDAQIQVAGLWAEVLGLDEVGIDDDFLDLGGNSILAARIASRIARLTGMQISLAGVLSCSTVADMAALIEAVQPESEQITLDAEHLLAEIEGMSDDQAAAFLAELQA